MIVDVVTAAAKVAGISAHLLLAVCHTETRLTNVLTVSDGGSASYGPCQVKLATARMFLPRVTPAELMHPDTNALVAALYLRHQLNRYHNTGCAVVAYNRGSFICGRLFDKRYKSSYLEKVKMTLRNRSWMN